MSIGLLPTVVDTGAHEFYIRQFLSTWERLCLQAFDEMDEALRAHLLGLSNVHFARFQSSHFHEVVK
jgi:hypothetical protein